MMKLDTSLQLICRLAGCLFVLSTILLINTKTCFCDSNIPPIPAWPGDVQLSTAVGDQREIFMLPTRSGGAIIVWKNSANGNVYAQKIDRQGRILWKEEGNDVAGAPWYQFAPKAASDGAGGAIVTWVDGRKGFCSAGFQGQCVIYAQRIGSSGQKLWGDTGVPICTTEGNKGNRRHTAIIPDGEGGAIIIWNDARPPNCCRIFAQRINANGEIQWALNGIPISPEPTYVIGPMSGSTFMLSDGEGGALIMWLDYQNPTITPTPYLMMQRVNRDGHFLWGQKGIIISSPSHGNYSLSTDGFNGALVAWTKSISQDINVYVQRISHSGNKLWGAEGVMVTNEPHYQWFPQIAPDGYGGAIVVWGDERNHPPYETGGCDSAYGNCDIFAQRLNPEGHMMWQSNGIPITTVLGNQFLPEIVSDGTHGGIIAWQDCREVYDDPICGSNLQCQCLLEMDVYAQRVDENGQILWQSDGSPVSTAAGNQGVGPGNPAFHEFAIINNEPGGAMVGWPDGRHYLCGYPQSPSNCELYTQMLTDYVPQINTIPGALQLLLLD